MKRPIFFSFFHYISGFNYLSLAFRFYRNRARHGCWFMVYPARINHLRATPFRQKQNQPFVTLGSNISSARFNVTQFETSPQKMRLKITANVVERNQRRLCNDRDTCCSPASKHPWEAVRLDLRQLYSIVEKNKRDRSCEIYVLQKVRTNSVVSYLSLVGQLYY